MRGAVTGGTVPGGRRRKDGPDRRGGEAHVAEWPRVGAKRVLGDVGRGEGSGAQGERTGSIVVMISVVVEMKGVCCNGGDGAMPRRDEAGERGGAKRRAGGSALWGRGRANE